MYFSDHGLNFQFEHQKFSFFRDPKIKQSYQIPFLVISGDIKQNRTYEVTRSGSQLINFFPTWFGVSVNLTPSKYDIFTAPDDHPLVMSYDEKCMDYEQLEDSIKSEDIMKLANPQLLER